MIEFLGRRVDDIELHATAIPAWQPFVRSVRFAEQVLFGEVTEALRANSANLVTGFRFRVDKVLRGTGPSEITVDERPVVQSRSYCPAELSVHVGNRLALTFAETAGLTPTEAVVGVPAFLNRDPVSGGRVERQFNRGLKRISLRDVRALVALPETDADPRTTPTGSPAPSWAPIAALFIALGVSLRLLTARMPPGRPR